MVPMLEGVWKRVYEMGGRYEGDGREFGDAKGNMVEVNFYVGLAVKCQLKSWQVVG